MQTTSSFQINQNKIPEKSAAYQESKTAKAKPMCGNLKLGFAQDFLSWPMRELAKLASASELIRKAGQDKKDKQNGAIAQLGEHLPCTQGVSGSIPLSSTIFTLMWKR